MREKKTWEQLPKTLYHGLEPVSNVLGTAPKKIGTDTKSNWNFSQQSSKMNCWNEFQILLETEPIVI